MSERTDQEVAEALVAHSMWKWEIGMVFTIKHIKRAAGGAAVYPNEYLICGGFRRFDHETQTVSDDSVPQGALPALWAPCTWGVLLGMCASAGGWPDLDPWSDEHDERPDARVGVQIAEYLLDLWGAP